MWLPMGMSEVPVNYLCCHGGLTMWWKLTLSIWLSILGNPLQITVTSCWEEARWLGLCLMLAVSELLIGELAEVPWTIQSEGREELTTHPMGHQTKSVYTHS